MQSLFIRLLLIFTITSTQLKMAGRILVCSRTHSLDGSFYIKIWCIIAICPCPLFLVHFVPHKNSEPTLSMAGPSLKLQLSVKKQQIREKELLNARKLPQINNSKRAWRSCFRLTGSARLMPTENDTDFFYYTSLWHRCCSCFVFGEREPIQ